MKLLLITIAALVLVGCGESQQSATAPEVKPVAEAATPEPTTAKAPDISIYDAVTEVNIEAVKQHLAAGTDVNAKLAHGQDGITLLQLAAAGGHKELAELLIANGADVNAKDGYGNTPVDIAILSAIPFNTNHTETANLLRKHGGKTRDELEAEGK